MKHKRKQSKMGRPRLARGGAKGRIVPIRFDEDDDLGLVAAAARLDGESLSAWVRKTLRAAAEAHMCNATLHDAIRMVLERMPNKSASTEQIAEQIARAGLYKRKDGQTAKKHQIYSRARKYPELFVLRDPQTVALISGRDV